jgi:hypothetical protein
MQIDICFAKIKPLFSGIFCLFIIFIFITIICYVRPPLGDDVLGQFANNSSFYSDKVELNLGPRIISIFDAFVEACNSYMNWGGRFIGYFLIGLSGILSHFFVAVFSGLIITGIIFVSAIIIWGSLKKALEHPLVIIMLFLYLFYYHQSIGYTLMWTMISIYSVSLLLILCYDLFYKKIIDMGNVEYKKSGRIGGGGIIILNILGFFTGFTHEIFSVSFCVYVFIICLIEIIKYKKNKVIFLYHIGLTIGTALCVLAPGNFQRAISVHDRSLFDPFITKFIKVVKTHIFSMIGVKPYIPFLVSCFLIIILAYECIFFISFRKKNIIFAERQSRAVWYCGTMLILLLVSFVLWSLVSYVPMYGLVFFNAFLMIFVFRFFNITHSISYAEKKGGFLFIVNAVVTLFFITYLSIANVPWIASNFKTKLRWNDLVKYANDNELEQIEVPKFEEKYSNRFNFYNYNNVKDEYTNEYYKEYYGTLVIPK